MPNAEMEFSGRVAMVTGGARGIGRACCLRLAAGGARIALNYVRNDAAAAETKAMVEERGGVCELFRADVGDEAAFAAAAESARASLGPITMLVANAGTTRPSDHADLDVAAWRETMRVNLDGPFIAIQEIKKDMLEQGDGTIVCLGSIAALSPRARQIDYAAAKAGVLAMTRCFAEALAPSVRVNAVAPGLTETEMLDDLDRSILPARIDAMPMKRLGKPEDIAEAAAFLLSNRAGFITGHTMIVSGGDVM